MNLWGVAVLGLDSHPDHNKGPDQRIMRLSKDPSHRLLILAILYTADNPPKPDLFDCPNNNGVGGYFECSTCTPHDKSYFE